MRVLIVTRSYDHSIGGMEKHTRLLAESLASSGHSVTVLTPAYEAGEEFGKVRNLSITRLGKLPHPLIKYDLRYWRDVKQYLEKYSSDFDRIVNISMSIGWPFGWPKDLISKTVTILHGTYQLERRTLRAALRKDPLGVKQLLGIPYTYIFDFVLVKVVKRSSKVVVVSDGIVESLANYYKLDMGNIQVIKNFVDTELFKYREKEPGQVFKFAYVSRVHKEKGILFLVESLRSIKTQDPELYDKLEVAVVGDGPELATVKQIVEEAKLTNVKLLGRLNAERIAEQLTAMNGFLFPTLRSEGLPLSLLEALSCGLICIASRVEGVDEIITDGIDGYLTTPGDQAALIAAISKVVGQGQNLEMSHNARKLVEQKYSAKAQLGKFEKVLIA